MHALPKDTQKKTQIIQAALKVFAHQGLEKGTIADIAKSAGIGKGTVYEYFNSKADIFEHLMVEYFENMMLGWQKIIESEPNYINKITKLIDYSFLIFEDMSTEYQADFFIILEIFLYGFRQQMTGEPSIDLAKIMRELYAMLLPATKEGIEKDILKPMDPEHLNFLLFAALDGIVLHFLLQKEHYDHKQLLDDTKQILLNGILIEKYK